MHELSASYTVRRQTNRAPPTGVLPPAVLVLRMMFRGCSALIT